MPFNWSNAVVVVLDNASGSTSRITSYCNQHSVAGVVNMLDKTCLGDTTRTFFPGLAGATIRLNGFNNSTTEAIFGPLQGIRTSVKKTFGIKRGAKWQVAEVWVGNVEISG